MEHTTGTHEMSKATDTEETIVCYRPQVVSAHGIEISTKKNTKNMRLKTVHTAKRPLSDDGWKKATAYTCV